MISLGDVFVALRADGKPLRNDLEDARKQTQTWATNLGGKVSSLLGGALAVGASAAAGAIVGIGTAAFSTASEVEAGQKKIQSQLGLTAEQAERYGDSIKNIYANNFGDNLTDVAQSLTEVEAAFTRIGGTESFGELERATEAAIALRDTFGIEVVESTEAAVELMDKFGLTSEQAFGFITSGFQQGLNASDDFLDSITEYSTQFANGGADATQFFSLLQSGLQAGNLGTDKAADAFKEFRLRINDGSTLTATSLEMLGINAEAFTKKLADGSMTTADAFEIVIGKLREIEDPTLRMQAAVGLIGTQFEDLGDSAVLGLSLAKFSIDDFSDAVGTLNAQYDTLPALFEGLRRRLLVAIEPLGGMMLDAFAVLQPGIVAIFDNIEARIKEFVANSNFEWSPDFKQIKLGDLFEWVQDGGVTKLNIGEWFEFTGFDGATQVRIADLFEFVSDSGGTSINIADWFTVDWSSAGIEKLTLGDLFAFEVNADGSTVIDLSGLISFTKPTFDKISLGDLFSFGGDSESGTFNLGGLFTFDPSSVGKVELKDLFPFLDDNTTIKLSDYLSIGSDYPVFDVRDLFPFLGEGGTFDLGSLFVMGEGGFDLGASLSEAATALTTALGAPDWLVELQSLTLPELKESTRTAISSLIGWMWPDEPATIGELLAWAWPDVPTDISGLLAWVWPEFSSGVTGAINTITSFKWPKLDKPEWIDRLLNFSIPTPGWVTALLAWSPSLPSLPSWLGGGGDESSGTSSSGSIGPNGAQGFAGAGATGGKGSVTVNIYNPVINSEADLDALAYQVGQKIAYAT